MFEVTVEHVFAAAHALRDYYGKTENVHGHNWKVEVTIAGEQLDRTGLLVDFIAMQQWVRDAIAPFDHQFLNEVPPFDAVNPSAENIARHLCGEVARRLAEAAPGAAIRVSQVRVWETNVAAALYRPNV